MRGGPILARERMTRNLAVAGITFLGVMALAGPSGLLAWSENNSLLVERQKELQQLKHERDVLRNRVALLDPRHVDPDMAGELLRKDLNVVHPDEMVMLLD